MIHNRSRIVFTGVWLVLLSCASPGKISVSNVNDSGSSPFNSFLYALPQTILDVSVTADEVVISPGPYQKYAFKYLGIKDAPIKSEHHWSIRDLRILSHIETDPDYLYAVRGLQEIDLYPGLTQLIRDSLILENKNFAINRVDYNIFPATSDDKGFTDLSVKRNFETQKDVEVSKVMPDTNYLLRSSGRTALKEKTLEQKAEEAANFLIKLKKRRFKLVAGQYDYMPEGVAMADALKELDNLEEEYLSLFIGKRILNTYQRTYHFTPLMGKDAERIVLLRFSENEGFLEVRETDGKPIMLELSSTKKIKGLQQSRLPAKLPESMVYYRIADQVAVKLLAGEQLWAEAMFPVFQSGVIVACKLNEKPKTKNLK